MASFLPILWCVILNRSEDDDVLSEEWIDQRMVRSHRFEVN
jgi:hypothetical protein